MQKSIHSLILELLQIEKKRSTILDNIRDSIEQADLSSKVANDSTGRTISVNNKVELVTIGVFKERRGRVQKINTTTQRVTVKARSGQLIIRKSTNVTVVKGKK